MLTAAGKNGIVSNRVPFAVDTLPECLDKEPNNDPPHAQKVELPIIVNGRIERPDDWDVFQFTGRAGEKVVVEVSARRLDSPLDSVLRVTDAAGKVVAYNDDNEDAGSGVNTHHADSYAMFELPADGTYFVHLGDVARQGGRGVWLSPADQRPAARLRAPRGALQPGVARQVDQRAGRPRAPQGRVRRADRAEPQGSARGIHRGARHGAGQAVDRAAERQALRWPKRSSRSRSPSSARPRSASRRSCARRRGPKTACRRSSGGTWCLPRR